LQLVVVAFQGKEILVAMEILPVKAEAVVVVLGLLV
jgi:hypothetical protein